MKRYIFFALAAFLSSAESHAQVAPSIWIQLAPGGGAEVRAVVSGACPGVEFDGAPKPVAMAERAAANPNFPTICSLGLPEGVKSVRVIMPSGSATTLVAPVASPERILVLGDTGCRIKGAYLQACNDPIAWPFAGLAKAAASLKPDLVIHLGDYLYRESPCPESNAGCAGSPYGDNWASWNADLFTPAAPLLAAAPWLIVHGNHEDCSRGGAGFLRLLGPVAFDPAAPCSEHLSPYAVTAGNQVIAVLDSASASDTSVDDKSLAVYRADFDALKTIANASAGHELWLVGHRPIWAAISGPLGIPVGGNATMIAAAGDLSPFAAISLMLSGHIHTFEAINYDAKVPPQIVAGHGGDNLDATPANLRGTIFQGHSGVSVKDGLSVGGFGFLLMTRNAGQNSWTIQLYDSAGTPERQCVFAGGRVSCPLPK
ncbi:MAG: metallophosphoesterase [Rhizomicrobium sp.]